MELEKQHQHYIDAHAVTEKKKRQNLKLWEKEEKKRIAEHQSQANPDQRGWLCLIDQGNGRRVNTELEQIVGMEKICREK